MSFDAATLWQIQEHAIAERQRRAELQRIEREKIRQNALPNLRIAFFHYVAKRDHVGKITLDKFATFQGFDNVYIESCPVGNKARPLLVLDKFLEYVKADSRHVGVSKVVTMKQSQHFGQIITAPVTEIHWKVFDPSKTL